MLHIHRTLSDGLPPASQLTLEADPVLHLVGAVVLQADILELDAVVVILVEVAPIVIVARQTIKRNLSKIN